MYCTLWNTVSTYQMNTTTLAVYQWQGDDKPFDDTKSQCIEIVTLLCQVQIEKPILHRFLIQPIQLKALLKALFYGHTKGTMSLYICNTCTYLRFKCVHKSVRIWSFPPFYLLPLVQLFDLSRCQCYPSYNAHTTFNNLTRRLCENKWRQAQFFTNFTETTLFSLNCFPS